MTHPSHTRTKFFTLCLLSILLFCSCTPTTVQDTPTTISEATTSLIHESTKQESETAEPTHSSTTPSQVPSSQPAQEQTLKHNNTIHSIEDEHIIIDDENEDGYVDNIIVILLKPDVEDAEVLS